MTVMPRKLYVVISADVCVVVCDADANNTTSKLARWRSNVEPFQIRNAAWVLSVPTLPPTLSEGVCMTGICALTPSQPAISTGAPTIADPPAAAPTVMRRPDPSPWHFLNTVPVASQSPGDTMGTPLPVLPLAWLTPAIGRMRPPPSLMPARTGLPVIAAPLASGPTTLTSPLESVATVRTLVPSLPATSTGFSVIGVAPLAWVPCTVAADPPVVVTLRLPLLSTRRILGSPLGSLASKKGIAGS